MIIDLHKEFLKGAQVMLKKVQERDVRWMQSFIISMIIRDLYTRNTNKYPAAEAMARTKEELHKLTEPIGLELGDLETFLSDFNKSIV